MSKARGGMSKAQAARIFDVSLSSVKRYLNKAKRGESLAPRKRPGSTPKLDEKATNLLAADLEERPYLTLQERCDYIKLMRGLSVSRSTMCRAIARIGPTRKKGATRHRARRVLKGSLAGNGGCGGEAREAHLRRGVWGTYLTGADLRLRAQRRAAVSLGTQKPGQEHDDPAFEHELRGDRPFVHRGRSDHRPGI
jgi:transposase